MKTIEVKELKKQANKMFRHDFKHARLSQPLTTKLGI